MADPRAKRIAREIQDVQKDKASDITITLFKPDDLTHLKGSFKGPEGTPYEGGHFDVDIVVPQGYPFTALKMKFITKVYHPNISSASGAICLDILKDAWTPVLTLRSTMVSLQSLLCSPEPKDPQDAEVAKHYLSDRAGFERTAKYWTEVYARPPESSGNDESSGSAANGKERASGKAGGHTTSISQARRSATPVDEVRMSGLDPAHVDNFVNMGFAKADVIDVMKRLNYRGANAANVGENAVLEALLGNR